MMEFFVEFEIEVPDGTPESDVADRERAEAAAAATLVDEGHLLRVWTRILDGTVVGLYRAETEAELAGLLDALPLRDWMQIAITPLASHPNDPAAGTRS